MKRTTKYVFLDVHQDTTVSAVREESGRLIAEAIVPTEKDALLEYFRGMRGSVQVAFEEGTQAQWLWELLRPVVGRVVVCDRRGESKKGNKNDKLDARKGAELLRRGALRAVYHGDAQRTSLKELVRSYQNLVEDSTRVMRRLKALFRARGIRTPGQAVYDSKQRSEWLAKLPKGGVQLRAQLLFDQLELLQAQRPKAKDAMVAAARRDPAWKCLRSISDLGPVRVSILLAVMQTPWRFRTKRNLWAYAGLAVVTHTSSEYTLHDGQPVRRTRSPLTRGLNRNHNRMIKTVFKSAAAGATGRPGPLRDFYQAMVARGMREELALVTLARKLAAITLRLWKNGERYDPALLTVQAR